MNLIKVAVVGAMMISGSAMAHIYQAPQEKVTLYQYGNNNGADVVQTRSDDSTIYSLQSGTKNYVKAFQRADDADLTVKQYGYNNYANVSQTRDNASAYVEQSGNRNWANVTQN